MLFLRHELQRNEVVSSLKLGDDLPSLRGDPVQLQQVIVNLAVQRHASDGSKRTSSARDSGYDEHRGR